MLRAGLTSAGTGFPPPWLLSDRAGRSSRWWGIVTLQRHRSARGSRAVVVRLDLMTGGLPLGHGTELARHAQATGHGGLVITEAGRTAYLSCAAAALAAEIDILTGIAVAFPRSPVVTASLRGSWPKQAGGDSDWVLALRSAPTSNGVTARSSILRDRRPGLTCGDGVCHRPPEKWLFPAFSARSDAGSRRGRGDDRLGPSPCPGIDRSAGQFAARRRWAACGSTHGRLTDARDGTL